MISWFEENTIFSWMMVVTGAALIFYISSIEFSGGPSGGVSVLPFLYHFLAFFFFGAFLMFAVVQGKRTELFFITLLVAALYAVLDEVHQLFVAGRYFSLVDIATDVFGIMFAFVTYMIILQMRKS